MFCQLQLTLARYFASGNLIWLYILPVTTYSGYIFCQLRLTLAIYFSSYDLLWLYIFPVTTYLVIYFASYDLLWLYIFPVTTYSGYIFCQLRLTLARYFHKFLFVSYSLPFCQYSFYTYSFLHTYCSLYLECLTLEHGGNTFLRNIESPSPKHTTLHPTSLESSVTPLREFRISHQHCKCKTLITLKQKTNFLLFPLLIPLNFRTPTFTKLRPILFLSLLVQHLA